LAYLSPYSPDLNLIEVFVAKVKGFIRRNWRYFEEDWDQGFDSFLDWCIKKFGAREESARGHFRPAALTIEESDT
jgi:transposase